MPSTLDCVMSSAIMAALDHARNNVAKAAVILDIPRSTLYQRLRLMEASGWTIPVRYKSPQQKAG